MYIALVPGFGHILCPEPEVLHSLGLVNCRETLAWSEINLNGVSSTLGTWLTGLVLYNVCNGPMSGLSWCKCPAQPWWRWGHSLWQWPECTQKFKNGRYREYLNIVNMNFKAQSYVRDMQWIWNSQWWIVLLNLDSKVISNDHQTRCRAVQTFSEYPLG